MNGFPAGQRIQQLRQLEMAIKANPANVEAHLNKGLILSQEERLPEAITALQKALSLAKKDTRILETLSRTCFNATDYQKAKKYARKLCELQPRNLDYVLSYAEILESMGQAELAMKQFDIANRIVPDNVVVLDQTANCLRMLGRNDEALTIYDRILQIDPTHPHTLYLKANSKKYTEDEAKDLDHKIIKALDRHSDPMERTNLYFSAGKIWQDASNYDLAFENFRQANAICDLNISDIFSPFRNSIDVLDQDFYEQRTGFGVETSQPIFILGMPRSGTTLIESLCGGHSKITAGDELPFMDIIGRDVGLIAPTSSAFQNIIKRIDKNQAVEFANSYLDYCSTAAGKTQHFTDKLPHNFQRLGIIKLIFPNAKIIHCRRHPIDNCISLYTNSMKDFHNGYKADLTKLGLYYRKYLQLMEHWRKVFPGEFHEVYYEDVVANSELNARQMMGYLELEWEDKIMDRQSSQKSVKTLSAWQVRQPIYTSSTGRWRKYETHIGPLIDALGSVVTDYENELART